MNLQHKDLNSLPLGTTINADDIASLSRQNRVKGIHPITHSDFRGVVILCTIGGENYANEWLNDEHTKLKYYLEGRTDQKTGVRTFNPSITSNSSIINSKDRHPLLVFIRNKKGELFSFAGRYIYERMVKDTREGYYFVLNKEAVNNPDAELDDDISSTEEGKKLIKQHYLRERDPSIIKRAIQKAKLAKGKVVCEICDFDFGKRYGERGRDFVEGHHKKPLSELGDEGGQTSVEDIALVCANCHRMIHRKKPWLTIDETKKIISDSGVY
jgi:predicted HNH restriction endonuclease